MQFLNFSNNSLKNYEDINYVNSSEVTKKIFFNRFSLSFFRKLDLSMILVDSTVESLPVYIYVFEGLKLKFSPASYSLNKDFLLNSFFFFDWFDFFNINHVPSQYSVICKDLWLQNHLSVCYYRVFSLDNCFLDESSRFINFCNFYKNFKKKEKFLFK